eukprot:Plantae.Rhodophyta-Purpureofilum_apyrenoidigerum.ctg3383.p1 GENE.Plantae.Rhodophyta-Purpureofilum_apyrenoidigerum.ctg3383~~Plantae.Rhodophyta-Purpureofilum_apyrenoidigerum.ctg3383.p1  ORF type:complete len:280 (-),score=39.32 Plantae.Rhodophyta-Purpureofilum_apyrenoidigerum.ctg3383:216-1055(-)
MVLGFCAGVVARAKSTRKLPVCSIRRELAASAVALSLLVPSLRTLPVVAESPIVVDMGNSLTSGEETRLNKELANFEAETGYKLKVLVQKRSGALANPKDIWPLDDNTAVIVVDTLSGNMLDFRVGKNIKDKLTQSFWFELQNRYGNIFYVKDNGEDRAVLDAVDNIKICLRKPEGCRQVPGFSRDQFNLTAVVTAVSGAIAGIAPRQGGKKEFDVNWLIVFSPLWGFILITFGISPIVSREGWLSIDLAENLAIFFGVAVLSFVGSRGVFTPQQDEQS